MTVTMLLVNTITSAERIVRGLKSLTRSTTNDGNFAAPARMKIT